MKNAQKQIDEAIGEANVLRRLALTKGDTFEGRTLHVLADMQIERLKLEGKRGQDR